MLEGRSLITIVAISLLLFFAANSAGACDAVRYINATNSAGGYVQSDGYPDRIANNNSNCEWVITVRPGYIIRFNITVGSIGDYWRQKNLLSLSDAAGRLQSLDYFESFTNTVYYTTSYEGRIRFSTENDVEVSGFPKGFSIHYKEVNMNESDTIAVIANSRNGTIQSSAYPDYYSPKFRQAWRITVDPGNVISLSVSVASMMGMLSIADGPSTDSSQLLKAGFSNYQTEVTTSANEAFVLFEEMGSSYGFPHGFTVHYQRAASRNGPCQTIRSISLIDNDGPAFGTITNDYYNNDDRQTAEARSHCGWLIKSRPDSKIGFGFSVLQLANADLSCWANVTIYDGSTVTSPIITQQCANATTDLQFNSTANTALVMFDSLETASNSINPRFALNYWEETAFPICESVIELNAPTGTFQSSGFPYRYDYSNSSCSWHVKVDPGYVIRLNFLIGNIYQSYYADCNEEELLDQINVFSPPSMPALFKYTFCNSYQETTLTTPSNEIMITFHPTSHFFGANSKNIATYLQYPLGFVATFQQILPEEEIPCREVRTVTVSTSAVVGVIANDYFPNGYDSDSHCQWIVTAPLGYIIKFSISNIDFVNANNSSNCNDYVSLYDGGLASNDTQLDQICGICSSFLATANEYYTTENIGLIEFRTAKGDDLPNKRHLGHAGFKVIYQAVPAFSMPACHNISDIDLSEVGEIGGVISNDGYPNSYDAYSRCGWRVIAPANYLIRFHKISVGVIGGDIFQDKGSLSINEGRVPACGNQLFSSSGNQQTDEAISSSENVAIIYFASLRKVSQLSEGQFFGFKILYTTERPSISDDDDFLWLWILLGIALTMLLTEFVIYGVYRYYVKLRAKPENIELIAQSARTNTTSPVIADSSNSLQYT